MSAQINTEQGFTIIELMIATAVLSVMLLLVSGVVTGIGNLYYKGVVQAQAQDDTRSITDDVAGQLQLSPSGSTLITGPSTYCIGSTRYTYVLDKEINTGSPNQDHVLWRDTINGSCTPANLTATNPSLGTGGSNGSELINPNSQLTQFSINSAAAPLYTISVGVAYGDSSLLNYSLSPVSCNGGVSDRFCATSNLTTTVVQRLGAE